MGVADVCCSIQVLQRERVRYQKVRVRLENQLRAFVAVDLGYKPSQDEKERAAQQKQASAIMRRVHTEGFECTSARMIRDMMPSVDFFRKRENEIERSMTSLAELLPAAKWVELPEQRGFGLSNFAIIIGEAGDLSNYSTVGKLWKRFGLAPWSFGGHTRMGMNWRKFGDGKLPAEEWVKFGYVPRRRAVAYNVGNPLRLHGKAFRTPYYLRCEEAKKRAAEKHPDWKKIHIDLHAHLLMTKMLFRNLWCAWNNRPVVEEVDAGAAD